MPPRHVLCWPLSVRLQEVSQDYPCAECKGLGPRGGCSVHSMACSPDDFWFINRCEVLAEHFGCERGCTVELGTEIPAYVLDPAYGTFQTCLVSQAQQPLCDARHNATARLCPCTAAGQ